MKGESFTSCIYRFELVDKETRLEVDKVALCLFRHGLRGLHGFFLPFFRAQIIIAQPLLTLLTCLLVHSFYFSYTLLTFQLFFSGYSLLFRHMSAVCR